MSPDVRVHVPSLNTRNATELCIRSMREYAGQPFDLIVGDSGSTDGSGELLASFEQRGWLTLELAPQGREHSQWLDHWRRNCDLPLAVFVDSDVEFRRRDWLKDLVTTAERGGAALVCAETLPEAPFYVEPVGSKTVRLAGRPAPWLLMLDVEKTAPIDAGFGFHAEVTDRVPEGLVAYDVGGWFFQELNARELPWEVMSRRFRRKYRHYSGLSWIPEEGPRGRKKSRDLKTVERRLNRLRARQEPGA